MKFIALSFALACAVATVVAAPPSAARAASGNLRSERALYSLDVDQVISLYQSGSWSQDGVKAYLNVFCQVFAGKDCWSSTGSRLLAEADSSFDSAALLAEYPDNRDDIGYTHEELMAWLDAGEWNNLKHDSLNVRYIKLVGSGDRGALVVSPGQSEPVLKYAETLRTFIDAGYSPVFSIDHVGQGSSDRLTDVHFMQHIEDGDQFIGAFEAFLDAVLPSLPATQPRFLACHSMGCAIAFTTLIRDYEAQRPTRFNAVVANAPLIKADTSPFPYPIAIAIGEVMSGVGLGEEYAPTKEKSFAESYGNAAFDGASTSSLERWLRQRDLCVANKDQMLGDDNHVGLCLGGLSANFAREFFRLYDAFDVFNQGRGKVSTPVMIQMAGDAAGTDGLVENPETALFCSEALKHCTLKHFPTSRHNIWWDADEVRDPALADADAFFQQHTGSKAGQCPLPPTCGSWKYSWPWSSGCNDSARCSYQYQFGDYHLGQSCRPRNDVC